MQTQEMYGHGESVSRPMLVSWKPARKAHNLAATLVVTSKLLEIPAINFPCIKFGKEKGKERKESLNKVVNKMINLS